jgi:lipopolysaccharide transport system ATP-binding protein
MRIIELDHVTKLFRSQQHLQSGLKSLIIEPIEVWRRRRARALLALDDVSFGIHRGEFFGVLGRNGAGKSTLLGLMGGILRPTSGQVRISGRVSPLMELGVGLEPQFTGRENILLNGILLGMRRKEVIRRMDAIIEFSGLRDFIEQPLLTYSAGMQMRLGFSVAVNSDPDILLVDEVLAVGDESFQIRCLERIRKMCNDGVTVVLVSHDLELIRDVCERAAWINGGKLRALGAPDEIVKQYRQEVGDGPEPATVRWRSAAADPRGTE